MPMMRGSTPATAVATMRAIGSTPSSRAPLSDATSSAAAPSLSPDELPAVTEPLPSVRNAGLSFASDLERRVGANELVLRRRASASPFFCGDLAPARSRRRSGPRCAPPPPSAATAARTRPDPRATRRTARRRSPRSGPSSRCRSARCIFGLTKRQPRLVSNSSTSRANGLLALRHHVRRARHALDAAGDVQVAVAELHGARGVRDGAHARGAQPVHRLARARVTGSPASSSAMRATLRLSSPAWLAQPSTTSATRAGSSDGCRASSVR